MQFTKLLIVTANYLNIPIISKIFRILTNAIKVKSTPPLLSNVGMLLPGSLSQNPCYQSLRLIDNVMS